MVHGRNLFIGEVGEAQGRTEATLVGRDETVCTKIPRKEQRVNTGVLEHDPQETAAILTRSRIEIAILQLLPLLSCNFRCDRHSSGYLPHTLYSRQDNLLELSSKMVESHSSPRCRKELQENNHTFPFEYP